MWQQALASAAPASSSVSQLPSCQPSLLPPAPWPQMENTGRVPAWRRAADRLLKSSELYATRSQQRLEEAGVSHIARKHPATGHWEVAPVLDGRIRRLGSSDRGSDASGCAAVS